MRIRAEVKASYSDRNADSASEVHWNLIPFLINAVRGGNYFAVFLDESSVEVGEAQKPLRSLD